MYERPPYKEDSKSSPSLGRLSGIGFEFAASMAGLTLFGYWIGKKYERATTGLLIGAALGILGGGYNLIRAANAAIKKPEPKKKGSIGPE